MKKTGEESLYLGRRKRQLILRIMATVVKGSSRETGAPGHRVLVLAAWREEDRALRAMVTRLKEQVPCTFEIINLESPTTVRYRDSSRALYARIRRYDAAVCALTARDGSHSPALILPGERLPVSRHFLRRIPVCYLVSGPLTEKLEAAVDAHARAWHLLPLGIASDSDEDGQKSLAASLIRALGL